MSAFATRCRKQLLRDPFPSTRNIYYIQDKLNVNNFLILLVFVNFFVVIREWLTGTEMPTLRVSTGLITPDFSPVPLRAIVTMFSVYSGHKEQV